mmetsp:Transcript_122993/g.274752  ORF Transcript_122993/g.274752 Transcript_122993/m.274752 type:complete len:746 (-) Transcript_122993:197-2434(-)
MVEAGRDAVRVVERLEDGIVFGRGLLARQMLLGRGQIGDRFHDCRRLGLLFARHVGRTKLLEEIPVLDLESEHRLGIEIRRRRWHAEEVREVVPLEELSLAWVIEHLLCQEVLVDLSLVDLFLESASEHQPVDIDFPLLSDPPCTLACLNVGHGVPVGVEDHDAVSTDNVQAHATDASRQDHRKQVGVAVELFNHFAPPVHRCFSIDAQMCVSLESQPALDHLQHLDGLHKDESPMTLATPTLHDLNQDLHLSGAFERPHVLRLQVLVCVLEEQVGMVAQLAQDADGEEHCTNGPPIMGCGHGPTHLLCLQKVDVDLILLRRHVAEEHLLRLVRQIQHIHALGLRPPEDAGLRQLAQSQGTRVGRGDTGLVRALEVPGFDRRGKLLEEHRQGAQAARTDEVEQRPELLQVVLDRRAREDDAVRCAEALGCDRDIGMGIPNSLTLVEDNYDPSDFEELLMGPTHCLIGRDQHTLRGGGDSDGLLALHLAHLVHDAHAKRRVPSVDVLLPLGDQRRWANHENASSRGGARPPERRVLHPHGLQDAGVVEHSQVGNDLHCLAKAHLVRKDAPHLLTVQVPQPSDARLLVRIKRLPQPTGAPKALTHTHVVLEACSRRARRRSAATQRPWLPLHRGFHARLLLARQETGLLLRLLLLLLRLRLRRQGCRGRARAPQPERLSPFEVPVIRVVVSPSLWRLSRSRAVLLSRSRSPSSLRTGEALQQVPVRRDDLVLAARLLRPDDIVMPLR